MPTVNAESSVTFRMAQDGTGQQVVVTVGDLELALSHPAEWELYETEFGVVMAEEPPTVAAHGHLNGLLLHVFVHPLDDINLPEDPTENTALAALEQIVANPEYLGESVATSPVALSWGEAPAAYYLMSDDDKVQTVVFAFSVPDGPQLVFFQLSAPQNKAHRIRESIPTLLDGMTVNNRLVIDGVALDAALPEQFIFPIYTPGD